MKSKIIAESGIMIGLTLVVLYLTSILSINTMTLLSITSFLITICIIRTSLKNTILVYSACSILSFLLVPLNISVYYIFFFGIYGIVKYLIEKLRNIFYEIILKLFSFNLISLLIYFILKTVIIIPNKINIVLLIVILQFIFIIYDYALTLVISYYLQKFHHRF